MNDVGVVIKSMPTWVQMKRLDMSDSRPTASVSMLPIQQAQGQGGEPSQCFGSLDYPTQLQPQTQCMPMGTVVPMPVVMEDEKERRHIHVVAESAPIPSSSIRFPMLPHLDQLVHTTNTSHALTTSNALNAVSGVGKSQSTTGGEMSQFRIPSLKASTQHESSAEFEHHHQPNKKNQINERDEGDEGDEVVGWDTDADMRVQIERVWHDPSFVAYVRRVERILSMDILTRQ